MSSTKCKYVIPEFRDINKTYLPFTRNDHWTIYEVIKTIIMMPIGILRVILYLLTLIVGWIIAKISIIGFDDLNLENLSVEIPIWRKRLLKLFRYIATVSLFSFGVHSYSYNKLTYKDLYLYYGYKRPDIDYEDPKYNIEPKSFVIVSNHLGYLDVVLFLSHRYNGSFVCAYYIRFVTLIGDIAACLQSLFVKKGANVSEQILSRIELAHNTHDIKGGKPCNGCYLCISTLIVFPEGTTTNSNGCLLPFRSSVFRSGKPIRAIVVRTPHKHFNSCWESIPFFAHLFRIYTQCYNEMEVIEASPYIPSEEEIDDPYLYSFNVNRLMCKMLGNNYKIYLLNKHHKKQCYHPYLNKTCTQNEALIHGKELFQNDLLIQKYLEFIKINQKS
eukprot:435915_1